ncbi:MAG: hypothetical protein ACXADS_15910 [Candidatus Thorarchaeota archaeon]|jgi:hypothetical protein
MATTKMSTAGYRDILIREGIHPPVTMDENGGAIFPGFVVTSEGETYPNVAKPDGIGDTATGIAGCLENQDIDTVYTTGTEIPVYLSGCGAIVVGFLAGNGGAPTFGEIMVAQTVEDAGYVETFNQAIKDSIAAAETAMATILATQLPHLFSLIGRAMETVASSGTVVPIKLLLSI